jgi:hypothetical protein
MPTIREDVRDKVAHLGHGTTTGQSLIEELSLTRTFEIVKPNDAAATDALTIFPIRFPVAVKLKSIHIVPGLAVTAHDTNYATLTLTSENGAGGGSAAVFACTTKVTGSTGTGDWVVGVPIDCSTSKCSTPFVPDLTLAAGRVLKWVQAKAAGGVSLQYSISIVYQLNG